MSLEKPNFESFDSTVQALFTRVRGHIEPGAHRMQRLVGFQLLQQLESIPTILVAGTNGKGTVCALLEKIFRDSGFRTGLYTSPHLVLPTERIRMNGRPISKEQFLDLAKRSFMDAQERLPDATFFELMTHMALIAIAQAKPDVFICEVGLGGRLDSTNVLSPMISVLTSVGLDHTEWLGNTEDLIAYEKSFVSRRSLPFVIGRVSPLAQAGIDAALRVTGAIPRHADQSYREKLASLAPESLSICAEVVQQLNRLTNFGISVERIADSARMMHWPGRFDLRRINSAPVLLDGAHNSHGCSYFLNECVRRPELMTLPTPWIFTYACLQDKDWKKCLELLVPKANTLILTQTENQRAVPAEQLFQYTQSLKTHTQCIAFKNASEALNHALSLACELGGTLFILGSLTLVGEAMEHFSIPVFREFEHGF